ncbi:hypothetical protein NIIDMKKI_60180 [Mycobacterium kansasii]|uniref:Uncharacterized protein n=1 Tax=Mycobacterium kansasii TaxID=1768 RepID=A0A7G1ILB7_MYCKA|nr:hypothetical protein NIIDMKKI_60180 [Mycobacterium kansasii]
MEGAAPAVANLYADLHINDRLQRGSGLRMDEVYRRLKAHAPDGPISDLWRLYQRIYEILWALRRGDLAPVRCPTGSKATPSWEVGWCVPTVRTGSTGPPGSPLYACRIWPKTLTPAAFWPAGTTR